LFISSHALIKDECDWGYLIVNCLDEGQLFNIYFLYYLLAALEQTDLPFPIEAKHQ